MGSNSSTVAGANGFGRERWNFKTARQACLKQLRQARVALLGFFVHRY